MSLIFMVYVNELSLERGSTRREQVGVEERTYAWHQGILGDSLSWWITSFTYLSIIAEVKQDRDKNLAQSRSSKNYFHYTLNISWNNVFIVIL